MDEDADQSLIDGSGDPAAFATTPAGAQYQANQDVFSAADNGAMTQTASPAGGTTGATTNPSWLTQLQTLATGAAGTVTAVAPLINGKPATGAPAASAAAKTTAATPTTTYLLIGAALVVGWMMFGKKK